MGNNTEKKKSKGTTVAVFAVIAILLAGAALAMYWFLGKTQYNSQSLANNIIIALAAGMVFLLLTALTKIRLFGYAGALALLYAFLEYVITEINFWSNWIIATDPVDPSVLRQYFIITGLFLLSMIFAMVTAGLAKGRFYKNQEAK